jgi:transposase-like protein
MHIVCPHCRNPVETATLAPNQEIACPSCSSNFRLALESTVHWENSRAGRRLDRAAV